MPEQQHKSQPARGDPAAHSPVNPKTPKLALDRYGRALALTSIYLMLLETLLAIVAYFTIAPNADARKAVNTELIFAFGLVIDLAIVAWAASTRNLKVYKKMSLIGFMTFWLAVIDLVQASLAWVTNPVGVAAPASGLALLGLFSGNVLLTGVCLYYGSVMTKEQNEEAMEDRDRV